MVPSFPVSDGAKAYRVPPSAARSAFRAFARSMNGAWGAVTRRLLRCVGDRHAIECIGARDGRFECHCAFGQSFAVQRDGRAPHHSLVHEIQESAIASELSRIRVVAVDREVVRNGRRPSSLLRQDLDRVGEVAVASCSARVASWRRCPSRNPSDPARGPRVPGACRANRGQLSLATAARSRALVASLNDRQSRFLRAASKL